MKSRYYRHPKTLQEMKSYDEESKDYIRAKRRPNNLPNAYDDLRIDKEKMSNYSGKNKYKIKDM